jgi:TolB-like protein/Tfp pilus assembly protein PilF
MTPASPSRLAAFLAELKRRRIFRVAVVYAGVAFIVFQLVDAIFEPLHIPGWVGTTIIVLLLIGFPITVGLAWAFDITEKGVVRAASRGLAGARAPRRPLIGNKTLVVIAAVAVAVAVWSYLSKGEQSEPITSIAVLPLEDMMDDPEQEYFTAGMHEAIISNLSRLSALKVISRTSAMRYKDTDKLAPEIARELGVDALVEGSVLRAGTQVRITAQLIHGSSDEHLWASDYEGDLTDILSLQKTVAGAIAREIGLTLTPQEHDYLASAPQVNPEAYQLYLKGWHIRNQSSKESMPKAVEYLEQAVAVDPTFSRAWACLAHSYLQMAVVVNWTFIYAGDRMKPALDKALELDPNLPEAHTGLGLYLELRQYDFTGAEASFERALDIDPDNYYTHYEYGWFLLRAGRTDDALVEFRRALELDPANHLVFWSIGMLYALTRQYDEAQGYFEDALELSTNNYHANLSLAVIKNEILMEQGHYAEVAVNTEGYAESVTEYEKLTMLFSWLRAEWALGNKEKVYPYRDSLKVTEELQVLEQEVHTQRAGIYAITGEWEKSLDLLERSYEDTLADPYTLLYYSTTDSLRADPRFKALLKKMGMQEVFDQYGQRIR